MRETFLWTLSLSHALLQAERTALDVRWVTLRYWHGPAFRWFSKVCQRAHHSGNEIAIGLLTSVRLLQMAEISRVLRPGGVYVASTFMTIDSPLGQILGDENIRAISRVTQSFPTWPHALRSASMMTLPLSFTLPSEYIQCLA